MSNSEWKPGKLADLADIVMGQSPSGNTCNNQFKGTPLLNGPTEFGSHHPLPVQFTIEPKKFAQVNDILFCVRGSTSGRMNWADKKYAIGRGVAAIRHKNGSSYKHFVRGLIELKLPFLLASATGSTFPNVSKEQLFNLPCEIPPLPEQKAIASILSSLDDKIELNQQMNQTLEAIARAIFKSWFVDFDPVRAKMAGKQPVGMDAATANLFPDSFEESALGLIPKGWKVGTIGESVKVVGGSTPSTKNPDYWENGHIYWTTPKDLSSLQSSVLLDTDRKITELGLTQISSGLLPKGTLLLSSRAPIGYLAISEIPVAINQGYIAMICNQELSNYYVLHWTKNNMDVIVGRANGTTFLEISKSNFRSIDIIIPNYKVLAVFNKKVHSLHQKIVNNLKCSRTLANIRDTLLPKLMSGEIRVKEAETIIKEVN
ncbi:MAG: restriction endonuclease subunit S [Trichodesmium sp. MAG_R01]|nr:restriction endonuclease subunit S [Trichodesmium sp. MAG_R01]